MKNIHKLRIFSIVIIITCVLLFLCSSCGSWDEDTGVGRTETFIPATKSESPKIPTMSRTPFPAATNTTTISPTLTNTLIPIPLPYTAAKTNLVAKIGKGIINDIVVSPDGKVIALTDGTYLRLLDSVDHSEIASILVTERGTADDIVFSQDSRYLAIEDYVQFTVVDLVSFEKVAESAFGWIAGKVFTRDNENVVYWKGNAANLMRYDDICVLSLNPVSEDRENYCFINYSHDPQEDRYRFLSIPAVSPDGELIAAGYKDSINKILYIWDMHTGEIRVEEKEQASEIYSVAFSPDGSILASAGIDGVINIWDTKTGKLKDTLNGFSDDIAEVNFTEDGTHLNVKVYNQAPVVVNIDTNEIFPGDIIEEDSLVEGMLKEGYFFSNYSARLLFNPAGDKIATYGSNIQIWDVITQRLDMTFLTNEDLNLVGAVFSPDGKHLAAITDTGSIFSWNLQTQQQEFSTKASVLTPGQVLFVSGSYEIGPGIGKRALGELGIAYSPDNQSLVFGNGTVVEIWDINTNKMILQLEQANPTAYPTYITYSPDGQLIYAALNRNRDVAIWNAATGEFIKNINLPDVSPTAFTAIAQDSTKFARNNHDDTGNWLELTDIDNAQITKISMPESDAEPLHFSPDGRFIIGLVDQNQLYIWRTDNAQLVLYTNDSFEVEDVVISPDGNSLATLKNGIVSIWDVSFYSQAAFDAGYKPAQMPQTQTPTATPPEKSQTPTSKPSPTATAMQETIQPPVISPGAISEKNASQVSQVGDFSNGTINTISWSPVTGEIIAAGSRGVFRYSSETLREIEGFELADIISTDAQVLPSGELLVAGVSMDDMVQVWDATSTKMLAEIPGYGEIGLSPDGRLVVFTDRKEGFTVWDIEAGEEYSLLRSRSQYSYWPVFDVSGKLVAAIQSDHSVRIWDVETGSIINGVGGPETDITDISFSPDGRYVTAAAGGAAWVWSVSPGGFHTRIDLYTGTTDYNMIYFEDTVTSTAMNPDNTLVAIGTTENTILLYSLEQGKTLATLSGHISPVVKMTFSPDGTQLASVGDDGEIILWDVANRKAVASTYQFSGAIRGFTRRVDGLILAWSDHTVWLFHPEDLKLERVTFIPDGRVLAASPDLDLVAAYADLKVSLYDAISGVHIRTFPDEAEDPWVEYYYEGLVTRQFYSSLFSTDGKMLVTIGTGGLWLYEMPSGLPINHFDGNDIRIAALSPDGNVLVASRYELASPIRIFNIHDEDFGPYLDLSRGYSYAQYAFSPDQKWIGMVRRSDNEHEYAALEIVDVSTEELIKQLDFSEVDLSSLAFQQDGSLIAVGQTDGKIALVDFETMSIVSTLDAHKGAVTTLIFSEDGRYLISGGKDGTIKSWGVP